MRQVVKYLCFLSIVVLLTGCRGSGQKLTGTEENEFKGYIPVEPIPIDVVSAYDQATGTYRNVLWASLSSAEKLALLPLQTAEVSVRKLDVTAGGKFLSSSASVSKGSYEVVMDYMKYLVDTLKSPDDVYLGNRRIGIGVRMTARVKTEKADLNIAGLGPLTAEATMGNLSGSLSVNVIGIDSRDVTNLIPITSQLDQTSIQAALQALAAVKTKMWDTSATVVTPHVVAVQQRQSGTVDQLLAGKSYSYVESRTGACIRNWWKPGDSVDTVHTRLLNDWLNNNADSGAPRHIIELINGDGLDELRLRAIEELGITCANSEPVIIQADSSVTIDSGPQPNINEGE